MNSKSLQYNQSVNTVIEMPALPHRSILTALTRTVINWFARSELEQSQLHFRMKRERAAQIEAKQDALNSLPLEEKHRLGLYQIMD